MLKSQHHTGGAISWLQVTICTCLLVMLFYSVKRREKILDRYTLSKQILSIVSCWSCAAVEIVCDKKIICITFRTDIIQLIATCKRRQALCCLINLNRQTDKQGKHNIFGGGIKFCSAVCVYALPVCMSYETQLLMSDVVCCLRFLQAE